MDVAVAAASLWDRLPGDFAALGYRRDAAVLFGRVQRVGRWETGAPKLPREAGPIVAQLDTRLPEVMERHTGGDGAARLVLRLGDGARVEAVHMPRATKGRRVTVCLSSQVGCAMGCTFCATARMGLVRNMTASEIVGQCLVVMRELGPGSAQSLNLVFMGMGEPLHNLEALLRAVEVLCDERGLGVAPSRITVSTAGHVPGIDRLGAARVRPALAVSVNEVTDDARASLMPLARRYRLAELRAALERWPRRPHEKLTLEYVVLGGENHSAEHVRRLAALARGLRHIVNLVPWNAWEGARHRAPTQGEVRAFADALHGEGCLVTVRATRARDARGACGTLVQADGRAGNRV